MKMVKETQQLQSKEVLSMQGTSITNIAYLLHESLLWIPDLYLLCVYLITSNGFYFLPH